MGAADELAWRQTHRERALFTKRPTLQAALQRVCTHLAAWRSLDDTGLVALSLKLTRQESRASELLLRRPGIGCCCRAVPCRRDRARQAATAERGGNVCVGAALRRQRRGASARGAQVGSTCSTGHCREVPAAAGLHHGCGETGWSGKVFKWPVCCGRRVNLLPPPRCIGTRCTICARSCARSLAHASLSLCSATEEDRVVRKKGPYLINILRYLRFCCSSKY